MAYCATPADVQRCIGFARAHGIRPIARCGGHSFAGYSSGPGLVVDVTPMNTVTVAERRGADMSPAVVGAGTLLVDLYNQLPQSGVLVPGGSCPTVGISGLALGGGVGVVGRKYGLTCDTIESVQIVTADGRLLTGDASTNADLYWACRGGGGGNFGIVTSFTFRTAPIPPLALFTLDWPSSAGGGGPGGVVRLATQRPRRALVELPTPLRWQRHPRGPDGGGVRRIDHDPRLVGEHPRDCRSGAQPSYRFVGPEQYLHAMLVEAGCESLDVAQCHLTTSLPAGTLDRSGSVASSGYVSTLPSSTGTTAFVGAVNDLIETLPHWGGGRLRRLWAEPSTPSSPTDTAFVHRNAIAGIQASWPPAPARRWRSRAGHGWPHFATSAATYVDGQAYQNYIDPTLVDWQQAYYGTNLGRLVSVKAKHDPDDVFHFAQSIPTGLATGG